LLQCAAAKKQVIPLAVLMLTSHCLSNKKLAISHQPRCNALYIGGFPTASHLFISAPEKKQIKTFVYERNYAKSQFLAFFNDSHNDKRCVFERNEEFYII
jgi:hypothetical protein